MQGCILEQGEIIHLIYSECSLENLIDLHQKPLVCIALRTGMQFFLVLRKHGCLGFSFCCALNGIFCWGEC